MEYLAACIVIGLLAILKALTAKYGLLTIPWIEVIRNQIYFGGSKEIRRGSIYLIMWIVSSVAVSSFIVFISLNSSFITKYFYVYIGYEKSGSGEAGLFSAVLFSAVFYLYLVSKTRNLVKRKSREQGGNNSLCHSFSFGGDPQNKKEIVLFFIRGIFYLTPCLMANMYQFFYLESSHLLHGAARLTFDRFGKDIVLKFFDYHISNSGDMDTKRLYALLEERGCRDYDRALALLENCIETKGYNSTVKHLQNYILKLRAEQQYPINQRSSDRTQLEATKKVRFLNSGATHHGCIPEYSNDLSGVYLATKEIINSNQSITLIVDGFKCDAKIIHKNALTSCKRMYQGCGVFIEGDTERSRLAQIIGA